VTSFSALFREDQLIAAGEQQPILLPAVMNDQLSAAGQQLAARHGRSFAFAGFLRSLAYFCGRHGSSQEVKSESHFERDETRLQLKIILNASI
jgi:hypothetical protein